MTPNDADKLLEAIFPEAWYRKVTSAIDLAVVNLNLPTEEAIKMAKYIIDWNIEQRLNEVLVESAETLLPKRLNWSKIDAQTAFEAFNALLETCEICTILKSYKVEIKFGENMPLYNEFLLWKEVVPSKFPKLSVRVSNTKVKGTYILKVTKVKQSKSQAKE